MVVCRVCQGMFRCITSGHLKYAHNITLPEYRRLFPDATITSDETRAQRSETRKGARHSLETCRKISLTKLGHTFTPRQRVHLSRGQVRRYSNPIEREKQIIRQKAFYQSLSRGELEERTGAMVRNNVGWNKRLGANLRRQHISTGNTKAWAKKSASERRAIAIRSSLTAIDRGTRRHPKQKPNQSELLLLELLNVQFPSEWEYVGNGQVWLGRFNPDFINTNGRKQLIELFGDYWHKHDQAEKRISYFGKYGFDTLIIWESELANTMAVASRIQNFTNKERR